MELSTNLTDRERRTIDLAKAIAVLSVIAAHVVSRQNTFWLVDIITAVWTLFGEVGVIVFFVIGGFLYSRKVNDSRTFWKKKVFRIVIPWVFCSFLTYSLSAALSHSFSLVACLKWMLGSGTWYYYATLYIFFLLVFKWFYKNNIILYILIIMQTVALTLNSIGISTTIPLGFFTDYLNPIYWIGYFSLGVLLRKKRFDTILRENAVVSILGAILFVASFLILYHREIYTYFNVVTSVFCISSAILILNITYWFAQVKASYYIAKIGKFSFCIFLLHMQIVQSVVSQIPNGIIKMLLSPFVGLAVMLILISIGLWICKKLPFGDKIKLVVGL